MKICSCIPSSQAAPVDRKQVASPSSAAMPIECTEDAQCTGNALVFDLGSLPGQEGLRRIQTLGESFWSLGEHGVAQGENEGWDWGDIGDIQLGLGENASKTMTSTSCHNRSGWFPRCLTDTKICSCVPKPQAASVERKKEVNNSWNATPTKCSEDAQCTGDAVVLAPGHVSAQLHDRAITAAHCDKIGWMSHCVASLNNVKMCSCQPKLPASSTTPER